nr:MAG TPA: hypothetical protein [Crassvirales sp.]
MSFLILLIVFILFHFNWVQLSLPPILVSIN